MATYLNPNSDLAKRMAKISGYTGKSFTVAVSEVVYFGNTYWDEGTRHTYWVVDLDRDEVKHLPSHSPFDPGRDRVNHTSINLPPGFAVVEYYQGRSDYCRLHLHPAQSTLLLPSPKVELTWAEVVVLYATRSLKASYAGIKNFRFVEAKSSTGITLSTWEEAKASLITRGLLNKAGAITVAGRNAIEGCKGWPKGQNTFNGGEL